MSDPLSTDVAADAHAGADREAKIEQLLLSGLDHYFDGEYDQAINVWTRALFLDRGHARARAYIERARSALAERQRESEELLQRGLAAFDRGASAEARRLLEAAITRGAPRDEALSVLDRIQRLAPAPGPPAPAGEAVAEPPAPAPVLPVDPVATPREPRWHVVAWLALAVAVVLAAFTAAGLIPLQLTWGRPQPAQAVAPTASSPPAAELPLPRRGERALSRARLLAQTGRLRDALATLDQITITDEEKPAADRLRAEVQRQLLAAGQYAAGAAAPAPQADPTEATR